MNTTTFNGIEIPHTPENIEKMKKIVEEFEGGEDIKEGDEYFYQSSNPNLKVEKWYDTLDDHYRKLQGNCLPRKDYTYNQALVYFNKRDARRAAETKLRKIIADMNKKDEFVAKFDGTQENWFSCFSKDKLTVDWFIDQQALELWRYSSRETAAFINENHADLLGIYLERV